MKAVDLTSFINLGAALEEALSINPKGRLFDAYFSLVRLSAHLQKLNSGAYVKLTTSEYDLIELQTSLDKFELKHFKHKDGRWKTPDDNERDEYTITHIRNKIEQFRTVLIADVRLSSAFSVMRAGIFDVNMLVNCAHRSLDNDTIKKFDAETLKEIDDSGRCLAFNLPTASGFHAMRAVERTIKLYLSQFVTKEQIENLRNWGQYIATLEKVRGGEGDIKPSIEAIALIQHIKDIYRNPVIHPERVLSVDDANTLFHSTIAALTRIGTELPDEKQNQPVLFREAAVHGAARFFQQ